MALLDPRSESAAAGPALSPWWRSPRLLGLGVVALLHVGLITFILFSLPQSHAPRLPVAAREMFFFFPKAAPAHLPQRIEPPHRVAAEPLFSAPSTALSPTPPRPRTTNGLGLALFGCAPETLANLTPDERAHCGNPALEAAADAEVLPGVVREQAHDTARWQAALAARDAPPSCVRLDDVAAPNGQANRAALADPLCLLKQIENGTQP
jgi:hypothetical protein